jgi:hypothetical protein
MLVYIRVSVVLSRQHCRKEREKMISNLDSAVGGASWWFRKFSNNVFFQSLQESSGTDRLLGLTPLPSG